MDGGKLLGNAVIGCFFWGNCFLKAEWTSDDVTDSEEFKLFSAASEPNKKQVKVLLKRGVIVNTGFWDGQTALCEASLYGSIAIMRMLLAHGANPNLPADREGDSPLHLAMYCGSVKRIALLLDYGANPNARDEKNQTPLMWLVDAIIHQTTKRAEKKKAILKKKKSLFHTYPWERANNLNCYFNMVRLLVDRGADINAQNDEGNTVLHWATLPTQDFFLRRFPQLRLIETLVAAGADPTIPNNHGETALDIFKQGLPPCTQEEIDRINANDILPEYRTEYKHRAEISELLGGTVGESSSEAEDSEN
jgi:ankyrin repeat protein